MINKLWRKLISILIAVVCFVTSVPIATVTSFASQDNYAQNQTEEFDISSEKIYIITATDTSTDETITGKLKAYNGEGLTEEDVEYLIESNLKDNLELESVEIVDPDDASASDAEITPYAVETLFDIGCLVISITEFYNNPSVWNGIFVVMDAASVAFPFVPAVSGVKRMIKSSDKLQDAMKYGVKTYKDLTDMTGGTGLQAHHIMPNKFRNNFGYSTKDMFCIALKTPDHTKITSMMNSNAYGLRGDAANFTKSEIIEKMSRIYDDLYDETGDELYEFMSKFLTDNDQYGIR